MRAFTLVEVTVTVTVIGVMAAVAMPSVSRAIQRERDVSSATRVVDAIQSAREGARATLCPAEVEIRGGQLEVRSHVAGTRPPPPRSAAGDDRDGASTCNVDRVERFDAGGTGLRFGDFDFGHCPGPLMRILGDGTIDNATAHVKLPIRLSDGRVWTVEIWPASGAVRLLRS